MASLHIPQKGLLLQPPAPVEKDVSKPGFKEAQVMRLDLSIQRTKELVRSIRNGEKSHVTFGRNQSIFFGGKSHSMHATPETFRHELYHKSPSDQDRVYFSGRFSHKLEVEKVKEATADADAALETLKASLASHEKDKESKSAIQAAIAIPTGTNKNTMKVRPKQLNLLRNRHVAQGTTRSMPSSPALGALKTTPGAPTSAPNTGPNPRLEALRIPLTHLLAVRPVSERFLALQTRASKENCLALLERYGRQYRLDPSKWELSDRWYKNLDIWSFNYPTEEDRQNVIENAISAFDRLRLSSDDMIWDNLLPKAERGKGKCLSRHDFSNGPMPGRNTPRINVQPAEEAGETTGTETDAARGRPTPNALEPMARSQSQDTFKKKRVSEKEVMSKRLLAKDPVKAQKLAAEKDRRENEKKAKKAAPKSEGKYKSAEYVQDTDDDGDVIMKTTPSKNEIDEQSKKTNGPRKPTVTSRKDESKAEKPPVAAPPKAPDHKKQLSTSSSISSPPSTSDSSKSPIKPDRPAIKPPRPRTTSSPTKPSPLGSSPPTNASDFDTRPKKYANSSSSDSPLPGARRPSLMNNKTEFKPQVNGVHHPQKSAESLKRKADHLDDSSSRPLTNGNSAKRQRSTSPSSGGSSPVSRHQRMLEKAQYFKKRWAQYNKLHAEVTAEKNVDPEKKKKLWSMHERLEQMKKEIWDETGGK